MKHAPYFARQRIILPLATRTSVEPDWHQEGNNFCKLCEGQSLDSAKCYKTLLHFLSLQKTQ